MKTIQKVLLLQFLIFSTVLSQDYANRMMKFRFNNNGHEYSTRDFLSNEMNKMYGTQIEYIREQIRQRTDDQQGVSNVEVFPPENITYIKYSTGLTGKGKLELFINDIGNNFDYGGARFDTKVNLKVTAELEMVPINNLFKLKVTNATAETTTPQKSDCTPGVWCDYVWSLIVWNWALTGFPNYTEAINDTSYELFDITRISKSQVTQAQLQEAFNSFPMQFTISGGVNDDLVINIDFLKGTLANPTAFVGITPAPVSDPTFEHLGFNLSGKSLDGAFSTYTTPPPPGVGTNDAINLIVQSIKNFNGQSVVMDFKWQKIENGTFLTGTYDPNSLQGTTLETQIQNLYNDGDWAKTDEIMTILQNNTYALDVIGQLGGISDIKDLAGNSGKMAPDNNFSGHVADDPGDHAQYYYVNPNTYLYFQKILAHATVRRYRDRVGIWLIEAELNAAKLNTWWRRGNCWFEEGANGFQWKVWKTWVDAVRAEDPTAKIATAFHMLKFQYGLETFGPDCDIIGINLYPNECFAAPVFGFAVGEMVWAARRALAGMGWGNKQVFITETNYPGLPGLNGTLGEEPPPGTTLDQDRLWYSYGRQKKYLRDAVQSAALNGAKGFFWWNFLDSEKGYDPLPYTGYGSIIVGNSWPIQFKPIADEFSTQSLQKHFGKSNVTLTNRSVSNPSTNLGGTVGIYSERDNLSSGTSIQIRKNRNHVSHTYHQYLGSFKHQSWGDQNPAPTQFKLKEVFSPTQVSENRNAWFTQVTPISLQTTVEWNNTTSSTLNYLDPWWIDPSGNQNVQRSISLSPTFSDSVFINRTFLQGVYYQLNAPESQTLNGLTSYFINWSGTDVLFNNSGGLQTGVVFTAPGATATANYKWHRTSSSSAAIKGNSQRKIIKDYNGVYHAVYEASGRIYYIKSVNGIDWGGETLLSQNTNNYRNPSIGLYHQGPLQKTWYPAVTWEYFEPGYDWFDVEFRMASGDVWEPGASVSEYILGETSVHGKPNVVFPYVIFQYSDGLYWNTWNANQWGDIQKVPNTTADSRNVSVIHGTGQDNLIHIAWEEAGSIYYCNASLSGVDLVWSSPELVASGSEMVENTSPSIALDNSGKVTIAWQYFHNELTDGSKINIRKRLGTNSYGSVTAYGQYRKQNLAPSISGSRKSNNNLSVVWHSSTNTIKRVSYSNNAWGAMYDMASNGVDAQIYLDEAILYNSTKCALYRGTTGTYYPIGAVAFTEPSGLEKLGRNSNIVASRSLVLTSDQGEHRIEIGEPTVYSSENASMVVPFLEVGDTIPVGSLESAMPFFRSEAFLLTKGATMVIPVDFRASRSSDDSRLSELRCVVDLIETGTGKLLASIPVVQRTDGGKQIITPKLGGDVRVEAQVRVLSGPENARCHIENITSSLDSASIEQLQKEGEKLVVNVKPTTYELSQNYPNPFNPVTTIHYALPKAGTVMLRVYDITGKEVATLVDGYHDIGRYTVPFDGSGLASGLYIYKITSGSFTQIKKMMLVK